MGLKDIFITKKAVETEPQTTQENVYYPGIGADHFYIGMRDAGLSQGLPNALLPALQAIYIKLRRYIEQDKAKQTERKNKVKQEIKGLEVNSTNVEHQINEVQDKLNFEESKIEKIKKEIDDIKDNPRSVSGDSLIKTSFIIGLSIIIFLTIYLFLFYSSAAYSAFFKDFSPDDNKITQAIFDAQAIIKAKSDGITELGFILCIPVVFWGLGFLIHKFSEDKSYKAIAAFITVTFIFDCIIAYEIVEKIYNIKVGSSFEAMPDMTLAMAFKQVNFWLIIFAGFIVYLIWGFVFNLTMKEYGKMDKVKSAIKVREEKLNEYKMECKTFKEKTSDLQTQKNSINGEIDKLKIQLEEFIVFSNDISEGINNYFIGWVSFMKSAKLANINISECERIKDKFFEDLKNADFIIKSPTDSKQANATIY